jgi:hypothetical protein
MGRRAKGEAGDRPAPHCSGGKKPLERLEGNLKNEKLLPAHSKDQPTKEKLSVFFLKYPGGFGGQSPPSFDLAGLPAWKHGRGGVVVIRDGLSMFRRAVPPSLFQPPDFMVGLVPHVRQAVQTFPHRVRRFMRRPIHG